MDNGYAEMRAKYMKGEMSHLDFYLWYARKCGIRWTEERYMGRTIARWAGLWRQDANLNNVPLSRFDALYPSFRNAATGAGFPSPSLSDNICVHKAVITEFVLEYLAN